MNKCSDYKNCKSHTCRNCQRNAKLRVCASCEWIYKDSLSCPKCYFCSYGARYVYGDKAYKFAITQEPWINKKLYYYHSKLIDNVNKTNPIKEKHKPIYWNFDYEDRY